MATLDGADCYSALRGCRCFILRYAANTKGDYFSLCTGNIGTANRKESNSTKTADPCTKAGAHKTAAKKGITFGTI